jgi:hypothetical protein
VRTLDTIGFGFGFVHSTGVYAWIRRYGATCIYNDIMDLYEYFTCTVLHPHLTAPLATQHPESLSNT